MKKEYLTFGSYCFRVILLQITMYSSQNANNVSQIGKTYNGWF